MVNKTSFTHPNKVTELAAGKVQSATIVGKRAAVGDITFSGQPAANDTFTLNGVVFTAVAGAPAANQFQIGAALTNSIDNFVAAIAAAVAIELAAIAAAVPAHVQQPPFANLTSPLVKLSGANYANLSGTKLHISTGYGSAGNSYTLAKNSANATLATSASIVGATAADFVFSGQPAANDAFTINGVTFTAVAGAPAANQFQIGAALTNSIDNFVAAIVAAQAAIRVAVQNAVAQQAVVYVNKALLAVTPSNVGGTNLHVVANSGTISMSEISTTASVSPGSLQGGVDPDKFDMDAETKALVTVAGSVVTEFDLPAGDEGQEQTVYLASKGLGSNAQVNGAFAGGSTYTLDTAGKYGRFKFMGASWVVLSGTGALA